MALNMQELGLVAGIPVGTSLIDAHAGGVGVMESVPQSDSSAEGYLLPITMTYHILMVTNIVAQLNKIMHV